MKGNPTQHANPGVSPTVAAMGRELMMHTVGSGGGVVTPLQQMPRKAVDRRRYLAGFAAGCISRTCTAPLDRLKVLRQAAAPAILGKNMFQSFKILIADGGVISLWRGNGMNVLKNGPECSLRFGFHGKLKDYFYPGATDLRPSQRLLVACLAGAGSLTFSYPLEVMKTRMALRNTGDPSSMVVCVRTLYSQGGLSSFFRGYPISMMSYVPYAGMELFLFELFKRSYMERFHDYHPGQPMPHMESYVTIGIILCASFFPTIIVYPANLLRTRFQMSTTKRSPGILAMTQGIIKADGLLGMYRGVFTQLMKTLPSVTISYLTFEAIMELMHLPTLGAK